ncbi:MAG: hypothetical protein LIV29_02195 [Denitrobacterium sp.]|nr:hypothetical protein [Denitrobacterium sp.]
MPEEELRSVFDEDDDFDPLAVDDSVIDQEDMDDDNPYDTVDYPTMREMPEHMQRAAVFTPATQGSAEAAIRKMFDYNPQRRPVLTAIVELCRDGAPTSAVVAKVDELQKDNYSVYAPVTLCRMLERAGALTLEEPALAQVHEDVAEGVEYLTIDEAPDPVWTATAAGLAVCADYADGATFKRLVLGADAAYSAVYAAVLDLLATGPKTKDDIADVVDSFPIVKNPRRFGGHFIDVLERADAIAWHDHAWCITDLGHAMRPALDVKEA